ncbi:Uncharacterized protein GBIM_05985 [Gryllus bimaculatus]|nr:Uncharacterized protein GBIM_05985 [Gryllus bimaculatus]
MSQFKEIERSRLRLNFMDSSPYLNNSSPAFSPMTNLALNLSDTNLSTTPRRKLSMCNLEDTPPAHRIKSLQSDLSDITMDSPFTERLLKNVIKLPSSPASQAPARSRLLPRRVIMSPLLGGAQQPHAGANSNSTSDKENRASGSPAAPMAPEDLAGGAPFASPAKAASPALASPARFLSPLRLRQPLEDHDPNSQDSGYGPVFADKEDKSAFRFVEPVGTAPRRQLSLLDQSPGKDMLTGSPRSRSGYASPQYFHSLSSGSTSGTESVDDGFVEFFDGEKPVEESQFPSGMGSLLSYPLKEQNTAKKETATLESRPRPPFRRSLSLNETSTRVSRYSFGASPKEKDETFTTSESVRVFKRPEPPCENSSVIQCLKRPKINPLPIISEDNSARSGQTFVSETVTTVRLQRSFSVSEATIKRALQRSSQDPDLIGDFSKPFVLPLMQGRHQDLKTISSDTLAKLLKGDYNETVDSYTIVDCRYPYEYNAGHIKGAKNFYTQDQISKEFVEINKSRPVSTCKRNILIFHCEFSSERGPKLSRFLRNSDRVLNKESYPALHYPEVYLLHGGYKEFYERHSELCEPCAYLPMLDPKHDADLRFFRSKTKSGDSKSRSGFRNLKRLGL